MNGASKATAPAQAGLPRAFGIWSLWQAEGKLSLPLALTTNPAPPDHPSPACLCPEGLLLEGEQLAEEPVGVSEETASQLPW